MYVPEYTITSEILKNISNIEYGKAIIESQKVLPHWEKQLQKEAQVRTIKHVLAVEGLNLDGEDIKRYLDKVSKLPAKEVKNFIETIDLIKEVAQTQELDETEIKTLHRKLTTDSLPETKRGRYRSSKIKDGVSPEVILAEMVELFDWYNSLDAKEAHPIIVSAIMLAQIERIKPFDGFNYTAANFTAKVCLRAGSYHMNNYYSIEEAFNKNRLAHAKAIESMEEGDLTEWLEYLTDVMAREVSTIKEKVMLLARDTKLAKASGRVNLTERQERIVEFLQDYGLLQNKAFTKLFPEVSEDSILRDLKLLIDMGLVVKRGKTKSSRYELK